MSLEIKLNLQAFKKNKNMWWKVFGVGNVHR